MTEEDVRKEVATMMKKVDEGLPLSRKDRALHQVCEYIRGRNERYKLEHAQGEHVRRRPAVSPITIENAKYIETFITDGMPEDISEQEQKAYCQNRLRYYWFINKIVLDPEYAKNGLTMPSDALLDGMTRR